MEEKTKESVFDVLSKINVNNFTQTKGKFKYLSWSDAVGVLLESFPLATWEIREWNDLPFLKTDSGSFVEVSVTVNNITRKQLHPILDYKNNPIKEPSSFEINTSIQRALAKAISLHGLGLYIYRGEDIPPSEAEAIEQMRSELISLLKESGINEREKLSAVYKLNANDLALKIEEYRKKIINNG